MNEEEAKKIIDNMSEQELNEFIFFALKEVEKENQKLKTELEKKDIDIIEAKEANRQLSVELQKKDKIINLIAKELVKAHEWFYSEFDNYTKEDFIKYFEKKVEEDK